MPPPFTSQGAAEPQDKDDGVRALRFRISCRLLRLSHSIDDVLPGMKRGESQIDWLVRLGVAKDKYLAAEALLVAKGLASIVDEILPDIQAMDRLEDIELNAIADARAGQHVTPVKLDEL